MLGSNREVRTRWWNETEGVEKSHWEDHLWVQGRNYGVTAGEVMYYT